jgi:hypothetical protein
MPYKKRHGPAQREPAITEPAITLYETAKRLLRRVATEENERALNEASHQLDVELQLRPWQTSPIDTIGCTEPPAWERGSALAAEDWHNSAAIRDELEEALRARRRVRRQARPNGSIPAQPQPN